MTSNRWTVRAVRTLNGREFAVYDLGPFRFHRWARIVAWLETRDGAGWQQRCEVRKVETVDSGHTHSDHPPWLRATA